MLENERRRRAIALTYQKDKDDAPRIVAKGQGDTADKIIALANDHNVPIQEDPSLVTLLSQLEINQTIPSELYGAVAEVFSFIYRIDQSLK